MSERKHPTIVVFRSARIQNYSPRIEVDLIPLQRRDFALSPAGDVGEGDVGLQILRKVSSHSDELSWFKLHSIGFDAVDEDGNHVPEFIGVPAPTDVGFKEKASDGNEVSCKDVVALLDDEDWPIKVTAHIGKLEAFMKVNDRGVRRKLECFPLIDNGSETGETNKAEVVFIGRAGYRVWREIPTRNSGTSLFRAPFQ